MSQLDLFGVAKAAPLSVTPDPEVIRQRLQAILDQLGQSEALPWTEDELAYHQTVIPQMANWLDHEEADDIRERFQTELVRLNAA